VIYLLLDRLHRRFGGRREREEDAAPSVVAAEPQAH
jgi:hypothetical protein